MTACCFLLFALLLTMALGLSHGSDRSPRVVRRLSLGWRFHRGEAAGADASEYDDGAWREVSIPHDFSIEDLPADHVSEGECSGPFDSAAVGAGAVGYTVGGVAWYRLAFALPESWRGKRLGLLFDGVYMGAEVWCNGERLGEHPYGYTAFGFDRSPG